MQALKIELAFPHLVCCELKQHLLLHYIMGIIMKHCMRSPKQEYQNGVKTSKSKMEELVQNGIFREQKFSGIQQRVRENRREGIGRNTRRKRAKSHGNWQVYRTHISYHKIIVAQSFFSQPKGRFLLTPQACWRCVLLQRSLPLSPLTCCIVSPVSLSLEVLDLNAGVRVGLAEE